jgi:hypothetical protein
MKFQSNPETQQCIELLMGLQTGESLPYSVISHHIGADVRTKAKSSLRTARRRLIQEHGRKFECVELSLRRLDDVGVIRVGEKSVQFVRRKARREFNDLTQCVQNYESLSLNERQRYDVSLAITGVVASVLQPKILKQIAPIITHETAHQRAIVDTMDAIRQMIT